MGRQSHAAQQLAKPSRIANNKNSLPREPFKGGHKPFRVLSKLKCPVFLASEMSGFGFTSSSIYPAVGAVGMWESQAAF